MALENNEKIKTADNAVLKAKLDRQIAFAQYLPKLDGSFTLLHMQNQDLLEIGNILNVSLQLSVNTTYYPSSARYISPIFPMAKSQALVSWHVLSTPLATDCRYRNA